MNKELTGFLYVSIWVIIWGTFGSLVDYPLLQLNIYSAGSLGQLITFTLTAISCLLIAFRIFPNVNDFLKNKNIVD